MDGIQDAQTRGFEVIGVQIGDIELGVAELDDANVIRLSWDGDGVAVIDLG